MSAMPEPKSFQQTQYRFAAFIRDPSRNPAPADVEKRRMEMYRELFFNNVESFLSSNFPVLRQLMDDRQWHALAQDFFARHRSQSPYFADIAEEFLDYLQNERRQVPEYPPFMVELAHYEWVEMALSIAPDEAPTQNSTRVEATLGSVIGLSPLAWPLAYAFPVHRIAPDYQPQEPPPTPTYLLVYRDEEDEIRFIECNAVTFRLLQLLQENGKATSQQLLGQITRELQHPNPDIVVAGGAETLRQLAARSVLKPLD